jgi:hypothetical protein
MGPTGAQRSRRRWSLGGSVLAIGLAGFQVAPCFDHDQQCLQSRVSETASAAAPALPKAPLSPVRVRRHQTPHANEAAPAFALAIPRGVEPDQLEICGFGKVPLVADDPYSLRHLPSAVRDRALDEVEALMLASPDRQVQAAALLIGAKARGRSRTHVDRLVRLALVSQDPLVYAIALEGCKAWAGSDTPNCSLLSLAQWVRLDPDNAQPWLDLAVQAQEQHDAAAEADAMRHAAMARRSDTRPGLLPMLVDRALGARTPPLQRTLAASESWGIQASWGPSHTGQARWFCAVDVEADPGRREICEAIAGTLSHRSTSVAELGIGLAIGKSLS